MYSIKVEEYFSSAHNLRGYKGKCEELHGHNWKIEACIKSKKTDKAGMVEDFSCVKSALRRVLEGLDHKYLNSLPYFKKVNPTSENIAKYIFTKLNQEFPQLSSVTVWESHNSSATYYEE
jgi:6-pyruvoyltetrahydropterin/6-carboxytetrahydropterin synthase